MILSRDAVCVFLCDVKADRVPFTLRAVSRTQSYRPFEPRQTSKETATNILGMKRSAVSFFIIATFIGIIDFPPVAKLLHNTAIPNTQSATEFFV